MFKKNIALLLTVMMLVLTMVPSVALAATRDYGSHWARTTIDKWLDQNLINGYPDGTFRPDNQVTRAEFVTMVNKSCDFTQEGRIPFTDVTSSDWHYREVSKAYAAGYILGISADKFAPNDKLTREQAALIITRIKKLSDNSSATNKFKDANLISSWALGAVGAAAEAGIIVGTDRGTFEPKSSITRAESLVMLDRALNIKDKEDSATIDKSGTTIEDKSYHDLTISDKVGSGTVTLKNVTVTGELLVEGGGEYSVILEDSTVSNLTINKKDGKVRVLAKGYTSIADTKVNSGAILEESSLKDGGFEDVTVENMISSSHTVTVKSDLNSLDVNSKVKVNVQSGKIKNMTLAKSIEGTSVFLARNVVVSELTINSRSTFTGTGKVELAILNAKNVTFQQRPVKSQGEKYNVSSNNNSGSSSSGSYLYVTTDNQTYTGETYDYVIIGADIQNVTFHDFKVNRTLTVNGGGSNSIHFKGNSVINNAVIDAQGKKPHIQAEDNTSFKNISINTPVILSSGSKGTTTFDTIFVNSSNAANSEIKNINVNNIETITDLTLNGTHVSNVSVIGSATLSMDQASQVKNTLKATFPTTIVGGTVSNIEAAASITANNTIIDTIKVVKSTGADKVSINVAADTKVSSINITPLVELQPMITLGGGNASVHSVISESPLGVTIQGSGKVESIVATNESNKGNITVGTGVTAPQPSVVAFIVDTIGDLSTYHKSVPYGTTFEQLNLPTTTTVTLKNNAALDNPQVEIIWDKATYDGTQTKINTVTGTLNLTNAKVNGSATTVADNGMKVKVYITVNNDTNRLKDEISKANLAITAVKISADGTDISKDSNWVTQGAYDAFKAAIDAADVIAKKETATQSEINSALTTLQSAETAFTSATKPGTLEDKKTDALAPTFTTDLKDPATYVQNTSASALKVEASVTDQGIITYQWYSHSENTTGGAMIAGATNKEYTPETDQLGTTYYYVVATNTNSAVDGNKTSVAHSKIVAVTIVKGVRYDLNGGTGTTPNPVDFTNNPKAPSIDGTITPPKDAIFQGWSTTAKGSKTLYQPNSEIPTNGDSITLYAIWATIVPAGRTTMNPTEGITLSEKNGVVTLSHDNSFTLPPTVVLNIQRPSDDVSGVWSGATPGYVPLTAQATTVAVDTTNLNEQTIVITWCNAQQEILKTEYIKVKIVETTK